MFVNDQKHEKEANKFYYTTLSMLFIAVAIFSYFITM